MKKTLVIILSVGINSILFSNSLVERTKENKEKFEVATCYTQTVTNWENSNGVFQYATSSPKVPVTCAPGQVAGFTTTTYQSKRIATIESEPI